MKRAGDNVVRAIEDQEWLDTPSYKVEHGFALALNLLGARGRSVQNALHGTWLGHPLHPVLVDVPLGAWATAVILDGLDVVGRGRGDLRAAARISVGVGVLGGVGAALSGLTDWQHTHDRARRVGMAHGVINTAALGLSVTSWAARRRGRHGWGRLAGLAGYGLASASSYLGGALVYRHRVGVDHAVGDGPPGSELNPAKFTDALAVDDLDEGCPVRVDVEGVGVVVVRHHGAVCAVGDRCPHLGAPMGEGWIYRGELVCPWHGSRFALDDGTARGGPATAPLPCFDVEVAGKRVGVRRRPPQRGPLPETNKGSGRAR